MSIRQMQVKRWEQLIATGDPTLQDLSHGPSPGGAAAELGISRQAVHEAIQRGHLDALAVYRGNRLAFYTISKASIARYKKLREHRAKMRA